MIEGFTTRDTRLRRNWHAKPRWWAVEVYVPRDTTLYALAKRKGCTTMPMRDTEMRRSIEEWLYANVSKKHRIRSGSVEFQNESDAMMFFLALK